MKNKLMYNFLASLIISAAINGSDGDSPEERSIVPHLDAQKVDALWMGAAFGAVSSMAKIPHTDLHTAVKDNDLQAVTKLVQSGVDLNSRGPLLMTALTWGAYAGCQLSIIDTLIRAGAKVNEGGFLGGTPLSNAIEQGHIEHVRVLLAANADANYESREGSVLGMAINHDQLEIAKMLIAAGARVNTELLHTAIFRDNLGMVKLLVEVGGANVNDQDKNYSALWYTKFKNNSQIVDYLKSKGAVCFWGESCSIQ